MALHGSGQVCFNSRPRTGGISRPQIVLRHLTTFQFSPPHRGHRDSLFLSLKHFRFQFSPPHRGHLHNRECVSSCVPCFNSRPRTGGIYRSIMSIIPPLEFQFSPPHRGHLLAPFSDKAPSRVSILAPAQGASPPTLHRPASRLFQFSPPHRGHRK